MGIVTKSKTFEPVINSIDDYYTYAQDTAGSIYIPNTTWPIIYQYDEPQNVVIRVDSTDNMTSAGKACADVLNNYLSPKDDTIQYKAKDLLEQAQQIQELSSSTNTMLIWIAGISPDRRWYRCHEYHAGIRHGAYTGNWIKKAIGARKSKILNQFFDGGSGAYEFRRCAWCDRRYYISGDHFLCDNDAGCDQYSGSDRFCTVFHGHRYRIRSFPVL